MGGNIPKILHIDSSVTIDMHHIGNGLVNGTTEISLKIILGIGQKNKWEVKWAGVIDEASGEPEQAQSAKPNPFLNSDPNANPTNVHVRPTVPRPNGSKLGPMITQVWRPRVHGSEEIQRPLDVTSGSTPHPTWSDEQVLVHSCDTDLQISTFSSLVPAAPCGRPIAEIMEGIGVIDRSWGSSSDWFLDLRDGRQLRIPVDLGDPLAKSHQEQVIAQKLVEWASAKRHMAESDEGEADSDWGLESTEGGSDIVGVDDLSAPTRTTTDWALVARTEEGSSTPTLEAMELIDGGSGGIEVQSLGIEKLGMCNEGSDGAMGETMQGNEDSEPIRVEPLAIVIPQGVEVPNHENASIGRKPSDWVLRKEKGVGKILGASYEGYE